MFIILADLILGGAAGEGGGCFFTLCFMGRRGDSALTPGYSQEWGGVLIVMHGRSLKTVDPRTPTMPGRRTSNISPTRQTLLAPSAKLREIFGE